MIKLTFENGRAIEIEELITKERWYTYFLGVDEIAIQGLHPKVEGTLQAPLPFYEALQHVQHASEIFHPETDWKNSLENLFYFIGSSDLSEFKNLFQGQTALLCGAGPSTYEQKKQLIDARDKAVLFGVGTGATLLDHMGIEPHFRLSRDPNLSTESKALMQHSVHTPFIMSGYTNPQVKKAQQGKVIYAPELERTLEFYFAKKLRRVGFLSDCGPSSGSYAISVAKYLGFSKILLLGYDFEKKYPLSGLEHPLIAKESSVSISLCGGSVETSLQHLLELRFLEGSGVVNVSNPNWKCPGVKSSILEKEIETLPKISTDLIVHEALQRPPSQASSEDYINALCELIMDLKLFVKSLDSLLNLEKKKNWKQSKLKKICLQSEKMRLFRLLRRQKIFQIFEPFDRHYSLILHAKKAEAETAKRLLFLKDLVKKLVKVLDGLSLEEWDICEKNVAWQEELSGLKSASQTLYENGAVAELLSKERGVSLKFSRDEKIYSIEKFQGNQREGVQKWYYPSGQESVVSNYSKGVPHGEICMYYPNGALKRRMHFDRGRFKGNDSFWNSKGEELFSHDF